MTDEQIIAAAGEPVGEMRKFEREGHGMNVQYYVDADIDADLPEGTKLYNADAILAAVKPLRERIEILKQEAKIHSMEARTSNATIAEIYQVVSGSTGEPGNWHGAEPVLRRIAELEAEISRLHSEAVPASFKELGKRLAARLDEDDWGYIEPFLLECERGYTAHTTDERDELRQQNAELTKQRDGLLLAVTKIKSDAGNPERVWRLAKEAISAHKTGGAV